MWERAAAGKVSLLVAAGLPAGHAEAAGCSRRAAEAGGPVPCNLYK